MDVYTKGYTVVEHIAIFLEINPPMLSTLKYEESI